MSAGGAEEDSFTQTLTSWLSGRAITTCREPSLLNSLSTCRQAPQGDTNDAQFLPAGGIIIKNGSS